MAGPKRGKRRRWLCSSGSYSGCYNFFFRLVSPPFPLFYFESPSSVPAFFFFFSSTDSHHWNPHCTTRTKLLLRRRFLSFAFPPPLCCSKCLKETRIISRSGQLIQLDVDDQDVHRAVVQLHTVCFLASEFYSPRIISSYWCTRPCVAVHSLKCCSFWFVDCFFGQKNVSRMFYVKVERRESRRGSCCCVVWAGENRVGRKKRFGLFAVAAAAAAAAVCLFPFQLAVAVRLLAAAAL